MAILQRWLAAHSHQRSTHRIHHKSRRIPRAGTRARFTRRELRLQPILPRVPDQCERVVLRPPGKYNQESVKVLPVRGGERVQVVCLPSWHQRKHRSCHSISLLSSQFSVMINTRPQTHCVQSFLKMAGLSKSIVIVKRTSRR